MKKLLFMIFLLGGVSLGLSSCGGGEEDATTDAVEEVADDAEEAEH